MNITIYVPDKLAQKLVLLPPRSVSRICQDALALAVKAAERDRDEAIREVFEED